jgi:DNA-binding NarL/FixJ family response regulator
VESATKLKIVRTELKYSAALQACYAEIKDMSKLKIAIIEDSKSIRKRLVELVEELGDMEVVGEASTEIEAIKICREKMPGVIILDMQLEVGNGLGVLKTMHYATAETKPMIIVLTNFPSPSVERAATLLGADVFLDKSLEFHKLPSLLKSAADALPV